MEAFKWDLKAYFLFYGNQSFIEGRGEKKEAFGNKYLCLIFLCLVMNGIKPVSSTANVFSSLQGPWGDLEGVQWHALPCSPFGSYHRTSTEDFKCPKQIRIFPLPSALGSVTHLLPLHSPTPLLTLLLPPADPGAHGGPEPCLSHSRQTVWGARFILGQWQ